MIYCLLTEFLIHGKTRRCCTVICYCGIKLKNNKRPIKVEDRNPGKMMLLHGKNCHILITNLSYLGVYQDEAKNNSYAKSIFGVGTRKN